MKRYPALLVIVLAVFATYAPAVRNGFVWDDTALVLRDPLIRSWRLIGEGFNHFLFTDATESDFYRPLQRLTYTVEYAVIMFRPGAYHLTNILLHTAAAAALFFFADQLLQCFGMQAGRRRWLAMIGALIWAVHPVQSAAVIYVSGRADPLAALFGFAGCYLSLRSLQAKPGRDLVWLAGGGVSFLLSSLSKEIGLIFPLLGIALFLFLSKRAAAWKTAIAAAFVYTIYLSLRFSAEHNPPPALRPLPPPAARPIIVARAFAEYAGLIALPLNLHMDRQIDSYLNSDNTNVSEPAWRELQTLLGILLLAGAVYATARLRTRNPLVFLLLVLTALAYLPISGVAALNASVAEHWLYLPSAFLFLAATVGISSFWQSESTRRHFFTATAVAAAAWLVFLSTRTFIRCFDWKNQGIFLQRTVASGGDSARMLINLGGFESSKGKLESAKKHLTAALRKEPGQPLAIINLGAIAIKENDFKTARDLLTRATQMPLVDARAHELLTILDNKEGRLANPLRLRLAARTGPPNWSIERRYIRFMDESGATGQAIEELQSCLQTEWYRAESWQLLSQLLTKLGRKSEADCAMSLAVAYDVHLTQHTNVL